MIKDRMWTLLSRKMAGEATPSELTELHQLLQTQPDLNFYLQAIDEFWKIPLEKEEDFLEATYHLHLNRLKERGFDLQKDNHPEEENPLFLQLNTTHKKRVRRIVFLSSALVALSAILFFFMHYPGNKMAAPVAGKIATSEISTKSGSRTKIKLPDGSSVWLNGGSKLVYDNQGFGEKLREVTLVGEGYFDVVKNVQKPFIIHTKKMDIRVLGTAFNVKAYPDEKNAETSLIRGSIEVTLRDREEKIMMKPNDKLIVTDAATPSQKMPQKVKDVTIAKDNLITSMGHLTLAADDVSIIETAWVENKLMFDNEAFEEVAQKMEKWYGVSIRFTNPALKLVHLTGTFEKETVNDAMAALQLSTPIFKYKIVNNNITVLN